MESPLRTSPRLDAPTALLAEGSSQPVSAADLWTDGSGRVYQPVLIQRCDRRCQHARWNRRADPGSGTDRHTHATQVTSIIASYLLDAGDVRGTEA